MKKVKVIQLKFRSNLGAQGSKLRLQDYIPGAPPQLPNKPRSLRATHSAVLTLLAMTPFQELYPSTRQPR